MSESIISVLRRLTDIDNVFRSQYDDNYFDLLNCLDTAMLPLRFKRPEFHGSRSKFKNNRSINITLNYYYIPNSNLYVSVNVRRPSGRDFCVRYCLVLNGYAVTSTEDFDCFSGLLSKLLNKFNGFVSDFNSRSDITINGYKDQNCKLYVIAKNAHMKLRVVCDRISHRGLYALGKHGILPDGLVFSGDFAITSCHDVSINNYVTFTCISDHHISSDPKFFMLRHDDGFNFMFDGVRRVYICAFSLVSYSKICWFDLNDDELGYVRSVIGKYLGGL